MTSPVTEPAVRADAREAVITLAARAGFELVRFAAAGTVVRARGAALDALDAGRLAEMRWMDESWIARATDASLFLDGAKTIVVVALPCAPGQAESVDDGTARGRVAAYAAGRDYHRLFEQRLRRFARDIREELGGSARSTVDYGPLLERPWAAISGMGWLGKSTMLLAPGFGPWVLLGAIATDLEIAPDRPLKKTCGSCARCIVACPTGAISAEGNVLDARLCISYHTIENRGAIPLELRAKFGDWVFGCDDCLTSCPVGQHATGTHPDFVAKSVDDARPSLAELISLDEGGFAEKFRGRAIVRAKRDGMARNACVALGNVGTERDLPALYRALSDTSPLVRGHAAWAIATLLLRVECDPERPLAAMSDARARETDAFVLEELDMALARLGQGG